MSRTVVITKEEIVSAAFKITKREGFHAVTSRKLAAAAGCSTQPIFRAYKNMEELKVDVYERTAAFYEAYYEQYQKTNITPFVDLGMAYIDFALKYPNLFRLLFLAEREDKLKSMYDLVNGTGDYVVREVEKARSMGVGNAKQLFMKMWIFIHGAGCMACTGDYDLPSDESVSMLTGAYEAFRE